MVLVEAEPAVPALAVVDEALVAGDVAPAVVDVAPELTVILRQTFATAASAVLDPVRVSPGRRIAPPL